MEAPQVAVPDGRRGSEHHGHHGSLLQFPLDGGVQAVSQALDLLLGAVYFLQVDGMGLQPQACHGWQPQREDQQQ